jgi:hypothetical protein
MIRVAWPAFAALLFLAAWTPFAGAQWLPGPAPWIAEAHVAAAPTVALDPATERAPFLHILGGAALGAAAGAGAGFLVGSNAFGPWAGGALGAGVGAHTVNHGQGSFLLGLGGAALAGVVMAPAMIGAYWEGSSDGTTVAMLVGGFALTQGGAAALLEWASAGW